MHIFTIITVISNEMMWNLCRIQLSRLQVKRSRSARGQARHASSSAPESNSAAPPPPQVRPLQLTP